MNSYYQKPLEALPISIPTNGHEHTGGTLRAKTHSFSFFLILCRYFQAKTTTNKVITSDLLSLLYI